MATKALTESSFKETIKSGIVLVDFWAPWCGPVRTLSRLRPDLREGFGG
jgi:thioredoxin 1